MFSKLLRKKSLQRCQQNMCNLQTVRSGLLCRWKNWLKGKCIPFRPYFCHCMFCLGLVQNLVFWEGYLFSMAFDWRLFVANCILRWWSDIFVCDSALCPFAPEHHVIGKCTNHETKAGGVYIWYICLELYFDNPSALPLENRIYNILTFNSGMLIELFSFFTWKCEDFDGIIVDWF